MRRNWMLALAVLAAQPAIADEGGAFEWTGCTKGTAGKNASVLEEACASVSEQCVMRGVRYILLGSGTVSWDPYATSTGDT